MEIRAYIMTCNERTAIRQQTIANLAQTDWNELPEIICDCEESPDARSRQVITAEKLLKRALRDGVDYFLFLEDDLDFNSHLRHNLLHWEPLRTRKVTLASLYNPSVAELWSNGGRHFMIANPAAIYGSQAFVLRRDTARRILDEWPTVPGMQDIKISRLAHRCTGGKPIYYHRPSLVQHVGTRSVWGGYYHWANDYDANFKAPSAYKRTKVHSRTA